MTKKNFFDKIRGAITIGNRDGEEILEEEIEIETSDENESIMDEEEEGQLAIDMYQDSSNIIIKTMVAGVRPEDLDISITRDMVTIRGRRNESSEVEEGDIFHKELYWGTFSRTIVLPAEIEIEEAEAKETHGLLTLTLPKIDKNRQSKLKVKAN